MEEKKLNIWLIREGEGLPVESNVRLMRMGMLAKFLSEKGHNVTWWTSTFKHGEKKYYYTHYKECKVNANETLCMLHSPYVYKKNVSVDRVFYNLRIAKELKKHIEKKECPDVILCAWPLIEFADVITEYGKEKKIPVIIDIRDFWPDIFVRALPSALKSVANIAIEPLKLKSAGIMKKAYGIVAKESNALKFGCNYAGREIGQNDEVIYMCNPIISLSDDELLNNLDWLGELGITNDTWNICVFTTLSIKSIDLVTVIKAVENLSEYYFNIRLIIGGKGDAEDYLKRISSNCSNIIFVGWLNQDQMNSIMKISKCGGYCLKNLDDFKNSLTNKAVQYMSGSLPILNSLSGFSKSLISQKEMGVSYIEGNVDSCCSAILSLYNNEKERKQMGMNALQEFYDDFEYNSVNSKFEKYIINTFKNYHSE